MTPGKSSLLVVDAQCGFTSLCPAELPVPGGLEIVARVNELLNADWVRIDASQDWHPPNHCSFLGHRDNLYPPHCVAGTRGAEFLPGLATERFQTIWRKGFRPDVDAYAVTAEHPGFATVLRDSGVEEVIVCGLATNICCFFAARDLRGIGFEVTIAENASAGIDLPTAHLDQARVRAQGVELGIGYRTTDEILASEGRCDS